MSLLNILKTRIVYCVGSSIYNNLAEYFQRVMLPVLYPLHRLSAEESAEKKMLILA